jgi:hypothetical protein
MKILATILFCLSTAIAVPAADDHHSPTSQEITNAKSQGLVWVNTTSRVYHKGGEQYGKTARGKFMTEAEARGQGYKPAKESSDAKPVPHKKDQSGIDDSANTHTPTPPKH